MANRASLSTALVTLAIAASAAACTGGVETTGFGGGTTGSASNAAGGNSNSSSGAGADGGAAASSGPSSGSSVSSSSASSSTSVSSSSSSSSGSPLCMASGDTVLAINKIYWGDTNTDGTPNPVNGWKQYGFDIDDMVSTAQSVGLCLPQNNASPNQVYPDGNNGIDNSFGKNLLPIFLGISSDFSLQANAGIAAGEYTLLVKIDALGAGPTQSPLTAKVYGVTPLGSPPKVDGTDCWPVDPDTLSSPADIESAKASSLTATLTSEIFRSGTLGTIELTTNLSGFPFTFKIHEAHIAMLLNPDHQSSQVGLLGGVLDTAEFSDQIKSAAGAFDPSLCSGPTIDSIIAQIEQASDIMADGTQNPNALCSGISIGLGFDASLVQFGALGPDLPDPPDPCP